MLWKSYGSDMLVVGKGVGGGGGILRAVILYYLRCFLTDYVVITTHSVCFSQSFTILFTYEINIYYV